MAERLFLLDREPERMQKITTEFSKLDSREGINVGRILNYWRQFDYHPTDFFFVPITAKDRVNDILQKNLLPRVYDAEHHNQEAEGTSTRDYSVVYRDPSLEQENGTAYTESLMIHEIAHRRSKSKWLEGNNLLREGPEIYILDEGELRGYGGFFEEAQADRHRQRFMQQNNLSFGSAVGIEFATSVGIDGVKRIWAGKRYNSADGLDTSPVVSVKLSPDSLNAVNRATGNFSFKYATIATDALIKVDDFLHQQGDDRSIFDAIERCPEPAGTRGIAQILNSVDPNLYVRLRDLGSDFGSILLGKYRIDQALLKHHPTQARVNI